MSGSDPKFFQCGKITAYCFLVLFSLTFEACERNEGGYQSLLSTKYSQEETAVYHAALEYLFENLHDIFFNQHAFPIMVPDRTLNYIESPEDMAGHLPASLEKDTKDDYLLKNKRSYKLPDICSTSDRCRLEKLPEANRIFFDKGNEALDLCNRLIKKYGALNIVAFSRPGINTRNDQALIYSYFIALTFHYGSYLVLVKEGGEWKVKDRFPHKSALINIGYIDD